MEILKRNKKNLKIGVFNTHYSLLVYLLIFNSQDTYFITDQKLSIKGEKRVKNLRGVSSKNLLCKMIALIYENIYLRLLFRGKKIQVYGQSHTRIGKVLVNMGHFFEIEDGLKNYKIHSEKSKNFFEKIKKNVTNRNIKKIYLTGIAPIPKEIQKKVELVNLKELWIKKNLDDQNKILDIFSFDLNIKDTIKGRDIILFTQPLSEDGVITEEEKIQIYSRIVKRYPQDRLIVKTHPREKTNYKEMFKDNLVLDNPFPFEILNLLDVKFNKAVTLFSTAALGLGEAVEVDFYGTEVNDKILARFGSCDNIMKRNSYLEEKE